MRITILNGEPDPGSDFDAYVHAVAGHLAEAGHQVTTFDLRALELKGCRGCWSCWVKTPGECARRDDSAQVCRAAISSGLLVLASRVTMGFTSSLLKRAVEQMIPLLHPHVAFALLLAPGPDADAEDLELSAALWTRLARNLKAPTVTTAVAGRPAEEVAHALAAA